MQTRFLHLKVGFWIEQGAKGLVANLKILKSRSMVVDINEQYRFTQCPETKRHIYLDRANGTATLDELNTNKERVLNLLKESPFTLFTAAEVNRLLNLGNVNYFNKKLVRVVDVLGRETKINNNQILFFIYEDGTIDNADLILLVIAVLNSSENGFDVNNDQTTNILDILIFSSIINGT